MNNKLKFTYLIPTVKPQYCIQTVINQISRLKEHEHEIIVISSKELVTSNKNVVFVKDEVDSGSVHALNVGYKASSGDVVFVLVDDHSIPENLLSINDYFNSESFKNKKMKVANLSAVFGGPGSIMFQKDPRYKNVEVNWTLYDNASCSATVGAGPFPIDFPYAKKYDVVCFPVMFKETIEKYLDGKIYNDRFSQCYADHWLGFYCGLIDGGNIDWGPKDIWVDSIQYYGSLVTRHEKAEQDKLVFLDLVKYGLINKKVKYNA